MKNLSLLVLTLIFIFNFNSFTQAQKKDKGMFKEYEPGYYQNSILKDVRAVEKK